MTETKYTEKELQEMADALLKEADAQQHEIEEEVIKSNKGNRKQLYPYHNPLQSCIKSFFTPLYFIRAWSFSAPRPARRSWRRSRR